MGVRDGSMTMWQRSSAVREPTGRYGVLAVQACNVVLALILINVFAGFVFAIKDEHDRRQLPPELTAVAQRQGLSVLYPDWDERAVVALYEEWNGIKYTYDPAAQFAMRPTQGGIATEPESSPPPPGLRF
jgi:hypothetical protein